VKTIFHFLFWRTSIECRDIEDMLLLISCLRPRIFKLKAKLKTGGAAEEQQSTSDFQQDARFENPDSSNAIRPMQFHSFARRSTIKINLCLCDVTMEVGAAATAPSRLKPAIPGSAGRPMTMDTC